MHEVVLGTDKKLAIIGSGIKTISHLTHEAKTYLSNSDKVLYLINEPVMQGWIECNTKNSESLDKIYFSFDKRLDAYSAIEKKLLNELSNFNSISLVIYGHPTVFASVGLNLLRSLNDSPWNIKHVVIPGISSLDCLFCDLRIDPGEFGVITVEATEMLLYQKAIDSGYHVILYQVGMLGNIGKPTYEVCKVKLIYLVEYLLNFYKKDQKIILYEAAIYPGMRPLILESTIEKLPFQNFSPITTLYIPPRNKGKLFAEAMLKLEISEKDLIPS